MSDNFSHFIIEVKSCVHFMICFKMMVYDIILSILSGCVLDV